MLQLSDKWGPVLVSQAETGMGYQVATIILKDGTRYDQAVIEAGCITKIRGLGDVPFDEHQIADIVVTHDRWIFASGQ